MNAVVHVILWLFIGAIFVAILTHPKGFASAVTAVGGQITTSANVLTGAYVTNPG